MAVMRELIGTAPTRRLPITVSCQGLLPDAQLEAIDRANGLTGRAQLKRDVIKRG